MSPDFKSFSVDCSQSSVAYFFDQYHLLSAPITDESGSIVGVITTDDAMAVLKKDTEEDLLHLGGVGYEAISDNLWSIARKRIPWLGLNLATAVLASYVISFFSETIEHLVAVAILMPIVASMGGNAGTQTLTIAVRALATKKLTQTNMPRVVVREIFLGCINGIVFALLMAILEYIWFHNFKLSIVLAFAMIINMIVAGIAGILVPLGLQTCGADPANGSSVFVTTVTDVIGFLTFLGLATVFLF
jgi:magnesium transporter